MEGLKFFGTLSILTFIIVVLLSLIWKKHRNWTVIIGVAMLYYWSLTGAWFIIYDQLTNNAGEKWGLHYYYYFDKLFHILLNTDYLLSLIAYGLFIILIEIVILIFAKSEFQTENQSEPIRIFHPALISIAVLALFGSIFFNYEKIIEAIQNGESIYVYTRLHPGKYFTLHQLCNEIAVVTLLVGIAIMISGKNAKFIIGKGSALIMTLYLMAFTLVMMYLVILGNRHDLILGGLMGLYLLYFNLNKKIKPIRFIAFILMIAVPLLSTDSIRTLPWGKYLGMVVEKKEQSSAPAVANQAPSVSGLSMLQNIAFSNEMFAAHMSQYGAMHMHIPHTYGSSLISLGASVIPRALWNNRPMDIYPYYANGINYHDEQGFTIHHATGWYLNFGWIGIIIGGLFFGWLWSFSLSVEKKIKDQKSFIKIFYILLPCSIAAFIPLFIRAGIEVYKPLLLEGILFPAIVIWIGYLADKKFNRK